ncbi:MAG: DUF559 domain-containing protein [Ornithinimicrobium sp.]
MQPNVDGRWPFLRQQGIAAGLTKHHLDGPAYHRLFGAVRVPAQSEVTPEVLARAAALIVQDAAISHHTAARLHGGVVPEEPLVHLTVSNARQRRRRAGLMVHVRPDAQIVQRGPLRLTSPAQTFCDLADHLTFVDLVVLGDSLVHRGCVDLDGLFDAAHSTTPRISTRAARAVDLVRERVESPMESRVRLMICLAGLPEPEVNISIRSADGTVTYRLDLSYPQLKVAIEYDGRQHAEDAAQWGHDVDRREWLDDRGWRLLVLRACDVYDTPWETVRRIAAIVTDRGYEKRLPLMAPERFGTHFPGRPWRATRAS